MLFDKDASLRSSKKLYNNVRTASKLVIHQQSLTSISYPHGIHEVRESEVLMAKDSPTVPDGEVDVVPGKCVRAFTTLHYNNEATLYNPTASK